MPYFAIECKMMLSYYKVQMMLLVGMSKLVAGQQWGQGHVASKGK